MMLGAWPMTLDQLARSYDESTLSRAVEYRRALWQVDGLWRRPRPHRRAHRFRWPERPQPLALRQWLPKTG